MTDVPGLEELTDELYAGPPGEFVARRDRFATEARGAGNRILAAAIKALRRPTVGAWYLNSASRAGLASLRELLDLGENLRQAQASGDFAAFRELAAQRGHLETRVLRDLAAHLAEQGISATPAGLDEARATLGAALADPAVEALLAAGRVDRPYTYAGFGDISHLVAAVALVSGGKEAPSVAPKDEAAQVAEAAEAAQRAAAERERQAAQRELAALSAIKESADVGVRAAQVRVEALTAELARAREGLAAAEVEVNRLGTEERAIRARIERLASVLDGSDS